MSAAPPNVLAIDVGNSRVKLGWFPAGGACASPSPRAELAISPPPLPAPTEVLRVSHRNRDEREWLSEIEAWLEATLAGYDAACLCASVNRAASRQLSERLERRQWGRYAELTASVVPIAVRVDEPHRVGVDRLLGALAANRLRRPHLPAITVDVGTAITINLIDADGAFAGGAILAGPSLSLAALHAAAAALPSIEFEEFASEPAAVGKSTVAALAAGVHWGAVGAVNELVRRTAATVSGEPALVLTGGGGEGLADHIALGEQRARAIPHLVLAGIRLAADTIFST